MSCCELCFFLVLVANILAICCFFLFSYIKVAFMFYARLGRSGNLFFKLMFCFMTSFFVYLRLHTELCDFVNLGLLQTIFFIWYLISKRSTQLLRGRGKFVELSIKTLSIFVIKKLGRSYPKCKQVFDF